MFEVGLSPTPVYRDGLTSDLSYVCLAAKPSDEYNAVVSNMHGSIIKFYPNAQFWGVTPAVVTTLLGPDKTLYNRPNGGYQGVHYTDMDGVLKVLDLIRKQRGAVVVDDDHLLKLDTSFSTRSDGRAKHPATHEVPKAGDFPEWNGARIP